MPATDSSVSCALSAAILLLAACSGPSPDAIRTTATAESVKSATPEAVAGTAPPPPGPQLANNRPSPVVPDPPWFSPAIFPTGTVTKKGRSPADDQGRFTAQILFQLPDGATLADCTDPLTKVVDGVVTAPLEREEKDGRVTLRGPATDYEVLFICGEAKGKMTAFVSYRWTAAQPVAAAP
jgi:hypothetical protein